MPKSLSRRKYARLTAFLTNTFTDPKTPLRLRMQAAMRLADILSNHDQNAAAQEIAALRAAARIAEATAVPPEAAGAHGDHVGDAAKEDSVAAAARAFLNNIGGGTR
jgi:hypothetical protein